MSFSPGSFFTHLTQLLNSRPCRLAFCASPLDKMENMVKVQVLKEDKYISQFQFPIRKQWTLFHLAGGPFLWPKPYSVSICLADWKTGICLCAQGWSKYHRREAVLQLIEQTNECPPQLTCVKPLICMTIFIAQKYSIINTLYHRSLRGIEQQSYVFVSIINEKWCGKLEQDYLSLFPTSSLLWLCYSTSLHLVSLLAKYYTNSISQSLYKF